jgi:hypothetical protein
MHLLGTDGVLGYPVSRQAWTSPFGFRIHARGSSPISIGDIMIITNTSGLIIVYPDARRFDCKMSASARIRVPFIGVPQLMSDSSSEAHKITGGDHLTRGCPPDPPWALLHTAMTITSAGHC